MCIILISSPVHKGGYNYTKNIKGAVTMNINEILAADYGKKITECANEEIYASLLKKTDELASRKVGQNIKKKLYYISAEFLIGKLLSNNLINLGIYDEVRQQLADNGRDICEIEEIENEPSLGNGGLGRLAACFMDSAASLGLNADGIGLNYHFGLFRQVFENNVQTTIPDRWLGKNSQINRTDEVYPVKLRDFEVNARMYDIKPVLTSDQYGLKC